MTIGQIEAQMSWQELISWMAFATRTPLRGQRMDMNFAQLCQLVHNVNLSAKSRHKRALLEDYMMFREKPKHASDLDSALYRAFRHLGA